LHVPDEAASKKPETEKFFVNCPSALFGVFDKNNGYIFFPNNIIISFQGQISKIHHLLFVAGVATWSG
jgi:hypothetical protein